MQDQNCDANLLASDPANLYNVWAFEDDGKGGGEDGKDLHFRDTSKGLDQVGMNRCDLDDRNQDAREISYKKTAAL